MKENQLKAIENQIYNEEKKRKLRKTVKKKGKKKKKPRENIWRDKIKKPRTTKK